MHWLYPIQSVDVAVAHRLLPSGWTPTGDHGGPTRAALGSVLLVVTKSYAGSQEISDEAMNFRWKEAAWSLMDLLDY
jgi:hypothetical protein